MHLSLNFTLQLMIIYYVNAVLRLTIAKANHDVDDGEDEVRKQIIQVTDSKVNVIPDPKEWKSITGTETVPDEFVTVDVNFGSGGRFMSENGKPISVSVDSTKLSKRFQLKLRPNEHLIDPHFVALIRKSSHSHVLMDNVTNFGCYYQSKDSNFAALDVCEGVLRGILFMDSSTVLLIYPLTSIRNGSAPENRTARHILIKTRPHTGFVENNIAHEARRKKRHTDSSQGDETFECGNTYLNETKYNFGNTRSKRGTEIPPLNTEIYIEIAVFVDKDLFNHMTTTFPKNTEKELIRFVLALINAVHVLYHDPTLGWAINFVLKRLEILHTDPSGLNRVQDIDKFLSSFCMWQHAENPISDDDPLHWDHAVILTGLDLYVLSKNGKASNQVVGLAPVAGMCTATSSCTVNEGRHFESAYVVAHEIGHNLGMRHDGPSADNICDPTSFLMSPTLGSGKTTWSTCSQHYLQKFLQSKQSRCLFDKSSAPFILDHSLNGVLPGERFDVHQQCQLKYGIDSAHSVVQPVNEVCKDLQCSRGNYLWTSHPALEGTICGENKWCRSGRCIEKGLTVLEAGFAPHQTIDGGWSEWSPYLDCASSCLHDEKGNLSTGSTGIMIAFRRCNNPRPENGGQMCSGSDRKYKTCTTHQCHKVAKVTLKEFSNDMCKRASEVDTELTGTGQQRISVNPEEACTVWCHKKEGGYKSKGGMYPDGTVCHLSKFKKSTYCIRGHCKEFRCAKSSSDVQLIYAHDEEYCSQNALPRDKRRETSTSQWTPVSDCFFNCITPGVGMRLVEKKPCSTCNSSMNVQVCQNTRTCDTFETVAEHATAVCNKFSQRVRRLSGLGLQLSSTADDPHRPCRLACQDEKVVHRFYLVNGEDGWLPFGTDCTMGEANRKAFCINGKCLEFNIENVPFQTIEYSLTSIAARIKRETEKPFTTEQYIRIMREERSTNSEPFPVAIDLTHPIDLPDNANELFKTNT